MSLLEKDYQEESAASVVLKKYNQAWLRDRNVTQIQDLDQYSLSSKSETDVSLTEIKADVEIEND